MLKRKYVWKFVLVMAIILMLSSSSIAQCAMCRATVASNLSEGRGVIGTGINFGILYLLFTPYVLVAVVAFVWFRVSKKELTNKLSLTERVRKV